MIEVRLPEISENVDSGDVVKILVEPGATVQAEQSLIELETDKAVFEVPSPSAGVVAEVAVSPGDTVRVGEVIVRIDPAGAAAAAPAGADSEGLAGGVDAGSAPAESGGASGPSGSEEPPAPEGTAPEPAGGADTAIAPRKADVPGDVDAPAAVPPSSEDAETVEVQAPPAAGPVPASPTVRRLARELGVDIRRVRGSGAGGRISADDVHHFARGVIAGAGRAPAATGGAVAARPLPDLSRYGEVERVAMSKIRQATARNMAAAWNTVPAVTQNDDADITDVEAARRRYASLAEKAGGKLTMTAILLKVCALALRRFPLFNSAIDVEAGELVMRKYVHVGVAVDTEHGLLVPVIRDADRKNAIELAVELGDLAQRARSRKLTPAQMEGAGFTVSNLGGIGGTSFSPIVNTPEVAILGVSRARMQPVWRGEVFEPRLVMPLSLTYDHRVIDGASAARFLRWICDALENPVLIAIDG